MFTTDKSKGAEVICSSMTHWKIKVSLKNAFMYYKGGTVKKKTFWS